MAKHRFTHNLHVPLIAVMLNTCLPGCSPQSDADKEANPFEMKDIPEDTNKKKKKESNCGEALCGGGVE